jgi:hypothetical protein
MRRMTLLAAFLVIFSVAREAKAAPITLTAGQSMVFNFDLSGETPPPPFQFIDLFTQISFSGSLSFSLTAFAGFDATGGLLTPVSGSGLPNSARFGADSDGLFSALFSVSLGTMSIDPLARGIDFNGVETSSVVPVPESASPLLLLGSGLLTLGVLHWRQRASRADARQS